MTYSLLVNGKDVFLTPWLNCTSVFTHFNYIETSLKGNKQTGTLSADE